MLSQIGEWMPETNTDATAIELFVFQYLFKYNASNNDTS